MNVPHLKQKNMNEIITISRPYVEKKPATQLLPDQ
jgi:hypothetical protein